MVVEELQVVVVGKDKVVVERGRVVKVVQLKERMEVVV